MLSLGMLDLVVILVIVLFVWGGRKLPELAKGLGEGLKELQQAALAEQAARDRFVRAVAGLCHPEWWVRQIALMRLMMSPGLNLPPELAKLEEPLHSTEQLDALLACGGLGVRSAGPILTRLLHEPDPAVRVGAPLALGVLGSREAIPALQALLIDASPAAYLAAARALAMLNAAPAIPIFAALAVDSPSPPQFICRELPLPIADLQLAVAPLLRAYAEQERRREWIQSTPSRVRPCPEHAGTGRTDPCGAREALLRLEQVELLTQLDWLNAGQVARMARVEDQRLFPALLVALLRRPRSGAEEQVCLAAVAGLEALGDQRCQQLLEWVARPRAFGATTATVRDACRTAAERLDGLAGRELVPAGAPEGRGDELVPRERVRS